MQNYAPVLHNRFKLIFWLSVRYLVSFTHSIVHFFTKTTRLDLHTSGKRFYSVHSDVMQTCYGDPDVHKQTLFVCGKIL